MAFLGTGRVLEHEIRQVLADYLSTKYGVSIPAENIDLWPSIDKYGNKPFADFSVSHPWREICGLE